MQKTNLIFLVIGGLILLGLAYSFGYFSGQKGIEETKVETSLADLLGSKVISGLTTTASGEVSSISGRNLTLSKEGDTLTISIREDASLYRILPPKEAATEVPQPVVREEIEFGELQVGDQVNIFCQLRADGSLEGTEITVLP